MEAVGVEKGRRKK